MPLTKAQRRKINAKNAQASTGPNDTSRTRFNALKHGLRAEVLVLPEEDPEVIQQRHDVWNDYYQPQDPAEQHLINECVRATLLSDRVNRFHDAELSRQVRESGPNWYSEQADRREHYFVMLKDDPAKAVRELKRFGYGLRYLIESWERLDQALVDNGHWNELERDEAIRLLGDSPDPETLRETPVAWITRLYNLICRPNPRDLIFEWLFHVDRLPDMYRAHYNINFMPEAETCRGSLRRMIAVELEPLRELLCEREAADDPDYAESGERMLILRDETTARLFLRYHAESRTSFQRAYSALVRTIDSRSEGPVTMAEVPASLEEADRVEEASPAGRVEHALVPQDGVLQMPSEGPSPNEANPAPEASSTACEVSTSVEPEAKKSKSQNDRGQAYDPKEDVGLVLMDLLYQEKLAAGGSEMVPISAAGAGS